MAQHIRDRSALYNVSKSDLLLGNLLLSFGVLFIGMIWTYRLKLNQSNHFRSQNESTQQHSSQIVSLKYAVYEILRYLLK